MYMLMQCLSTGGSQGHFEWVGNCVVKRNNKKKNCKCFSNARLILWRTCV